MTKSQSQTINVQPRDLSYLFAFPYNWRRSLFNSFKECPRSAFAYFCTPCYTAKLIDRTGERFCIGICNPFALMALRTKVRTAFRIRGNVTQDCLLSCCCGGCVATQIDDELNFHEIPDQIETRNIIVRSYT
ncbi:unnamed protein product [Adineta steineri]|uniref:Uncharacterized protein n=1 Tax=Adineta steineri TaxID=433720 RepID=A0A814MY76_9BILA|nr:unnamed protein product [Adineta steineri]CAF1085607.1 unnamed protein product [Adineta steineri]CAF1190102.1 unnamed protein product [Adineta steineri]